MTLVEILVSVVLLGMVVTATLTMLTATINGTVMDRDHSNGHAWLQTAADMLYAREPVDCLETNNADPVAAEAHRQTIITAYEDTVQNTQNPEDWPDGNIEVVDLQFWHRARDANNFAIEGWSQTRCGLPDTDLQRVLLRVRNPDGRIVEEVEVILGGD